MKRLHAHHVYPLTQIVQDFLSEQSKENGNNLRKKLKHYEPLWDLSNAITLCQTCHRRLHKDAEKDIKKEEEK